MSVHGGKVLMRKVYNRFPDMVDDESLIGNIWIIEHEGKEYWEKFILELKSEPPNNLPNNRCLKLTTVAV